MNNLRLFIITRDKEINIPEARVDNKIKTLFGSIL